MASCSIRNLKSHRAKTPRRKEIQNDTAVHHQLACAVFGTADRFNRRMFFDKLLVLRVIARRAISLRESLCVFASWRETALKDNSFIF
jgi:menaquinone-dependent protoporphyrinogen IX oxidase